jgi:flagellar hook-length control protein FliK
VPLAANTIITQSNTAAQAPAAKTRNNTSTDQTASFADVLAQQDPSATGNNVQAPAQGADKIKASKNASMANKSGNLPDDKVDTDTIATADTPQGTKVRVGKTIDKAKVGATVSKSAPEAVNDNEYASDGDLTQQIPPPPSAPALPAAPFAPFSASAAQPSPAGDNAALEAKSGAAIGAEPASTGSGDTNNIEATQGADGTQQADGTSTSGKAQSSNAFQKMLGATKAATTKDSQTAKAVPDKDIKTADANLDNIASITDGASNVKQAAPANTGTNSASIIAQVDKTATPTSGTTVAITAQGHTAPNLNSLAVEITAKAQSGAKQFDIRLDPPELGRVEVRLSIDATGKAQAHLSADRPQTLELLQNDAPALTRALRDAGLDVSQSGLNFSLKNQQQNSGGNNSAGQSNYDGAAAGSADLVLETNSGGSAYTSGAGLLDIKI